MAIQFNNRLLANQLSFGVLGAIEGSWVPMVPYVKNNLNLSESELGMLLSAMAVGSVLSLPIVGALVSRLGCKKVSTVAGILMAIILIVLTFSNSFAVCAFMLCIFGMSMVGVDVASNINAVILEKEFQRPLMSGFHGGYSLGTFVGTLLMSLLLTIGTDLTVSSVIMFAIMTFVVLKGCSHLVDDVKKYESSDKTEQDTEKEKSKKLHMIPLAILVLGVMCFIMYGTEGAVLNWSAVFAHETRHLNIEVAGYMYLFYAIAMTITRLTGNKLVKTIGRRKTVVLGTLLVSLGFFIATSVEHYIGVMIGWTVIGLGAGNVVPQLVSFAGTVKGIKLHNAISVINAIGYSGILCSPMIVGFVAKKFGLETSFNMLGCAVLLICVVSFFLLKTKKEQN